MKKYLFYLFLMFAAFVTASCKQNLLSDSIMEQDRPIEVSIEAPAFVGGGSTKASEDSLSEAYFKVSNVCFFEYQNNTLINHGFSNGKSLGGLSIPSNGQPVDIFLMANVGDIMQDPATAAAVQTEDGIRNYVYAVDSYSTFETEGFPCAGEYLGVTVSNLSSLSVKHLVGFYRFRYQKGADSDNDITALRMRQMASNVKPFGSLAAGDVVNLYRSQSLSGAQISKLQNGEYVDLYFFENLQGTTSNTDPNNRGNEINDITKKKGTIIDILTENQNYSVYLGQNNTNDYNILRSHISNLTYVDVYIDPIKGVGHEYFKWESFSKFTESGVTYKVNTDENSLYLYSDDDFCLDRWIGVHTNIKALNYIVFKENNVNSDRFYIDDLREDEDDYVELLMSSEDLSASHDYELFYDNKSLGAFIKVRPALIPDPIRENIDNAVVLVDFTFTADALPGIKSLIKRIDDEHGIPNAKFDFNVELAFRYHDSINDVDRETKVPFTIYVDKDGNYDSVGVDDFAIVNDAILASDYEAGKWYITKLEIGSIFSYGEYDVYKDQILSHFSEIYCSENPSSGWHNNFGIEWSASRLDTTYLLIGENYGRQPYTKLSIYMR